LRAHPTGHFFLVPPQTTGFFLWDCFCLFPKKISRVDGRAQLVFVVQKGPSGGGFGPILSVLFETQQTVLGFGVLATFSCWNPEGHFVFSVLWPMDPGGGVFLFGGKPFHGGGAPEFPSFFVGFFFPFTQGGGHPPTQWWLFSTPSKTSVVPVPPPPFGGTKGSHPQHLLIFPLGGFFFFFLHPRLSVLPNRAPALF